MSMKKTVVMALALLAATCVFARPHGGWGGPRYHGGWGGPRYHHGGYYHHHHHHCGLGLAAGIVGLTAATAAIAHDVIAPPPVVYSTPAVYPATYTAPVATTYAAPVATYPVAAPAVVTPAPVVYPATTVVYPRAYRRWYW